MKKKLFLLPLLLLGCLTGCANNDIKIMDFTKIDNTSYDILVEPDTYSFDFTNCIKGDISNWKLYTTNGEEIVTRKVNNLTSGDNLYYIITNKNRYNMNIYRSYFTNIRFLLNNDSAFSTNIKVKTGYEYNSEMYKEQIDQFVYLYAEESYTIDNDEKFIVDRKAYSDLCRQFNITCEFKTYDVSFIVDRVNCDDTQITYRCKPNDAVACPTIESIKRDGYYYSKWLYGNSSIIRHNSSINIKYYLKTSISTKSSLEFTCTENIRRYCIILYKNLELSADDEDNYIGAATFHTGGIEYSNDLDILNTKIKLSYIYMSSNYYSVDISLNGEETTKSLTAKLDNAGYNKDTCAYAEYPYPTFMGVIE